jgi:hypothetical protein
LKRCLTKPVEPARNPPRDLTWIMSKRGPD